jgi:hypothetical protein
VSPVRYELGFYILEAGILHSHRRECLKSCIWLTVPIYEMRPLERPKTSIDNLTATDVMEQTEIDRQRRN